MDNSLPRSVRGLSVVGGNLGDVDAATGEATILHADLDAFYASVEQRDDPRLRGRPVIVGGGVVLAASYEARACGVRTAMGGREALRLCPDALVVPARMEAYSAASKEVFAVFRDTTPLVEPVSIDEAYVDLAAAGVHDLSVDGVTALARGLKARIAAATGGVTGSIGIGSSKLMAKIGSDLDKPDGLVVVPPGRELEVLHPLPVTRLGGVGPATAERLHQVGVKTVGDLLGRLAVAQGLMLLMSYSGRTGSDSKGAKRDGSLSAVVQEIESEPNIARVDEAQFWQVHYGLCMANLKISVVRAMSLCVSVSATLCHSKS